MGLSFLSVKNIANILRYADPFAEADEDTGETKQSQNYIHIRIQRKFTFGSDFNMGWGLKAQPPRAVPYEISTADNVPSTERNGRKTLTTVQGLPKKFDQKKILKVIKKKFGRFMIAKSWRKAVMGGYG